MLWTETTRPDYDRRELRYASDLRDVEWAVIAPFMPQPSRIGRPRKTDLHEVVNAILYIAATGCQWRMLPKDFPPYSTVQNCFYQWRDGRTWSTINHALVMAERERQGREASPSAGVIDSQSVKTTEAGGISGYDAGKKINGRKRHILTDTIEVRRFANLVNEHQLMLRSVERAHARVGLVPDAEIQEIAIDF